MRSLLFLIALATAVSPALATETAPATIDTHIHLYEPDGLDWLRPANTRLYRPVFVEDFIAATTGTPIRQAIVVEADTRPATNDWLLDHVRDRTEILAVIGNLDLTAETTASDLERLSADPKFCGIRFRGHGSFDPANPTTHANLAALAKANLTLELQADSENFAAIATAAKTFPDLRIVIDHLAGARLDPEGHVQPWWPAAIKSLSANPNVFCKLSAFDSAFRENYAPDRLELIFAPLIKAFGPDRLLFGSNWPVNPDYPSAVSLLPAIEGTDFDTNARQAYDLPSR